MGIGEADVAVAPDTFTFQSGFGDTGPYAAKPVYDPLIQAPSGPCHREAGSDAERPRLVRTILPDKLTGVAAQAITAALLARTCTGKASTSVSMLDTISHSFGGLTWAARRLSTTRSRAERGQLYRPNL